jgi:hypothetical protein
MCRLTRKRVCVSTALNIYFLRFLYMSERSICPVAAGGAMAGMKCPLLSILILAENLVNYLLISARVF